MESTWIQTYTGRLFDPVTPDPKSIVIEDIAHALSNICRFTGHSKWHYSVAQHCVLVSLYVPIGLELTGLLHDASEAYLTDISHPVKHSRFMDGYRELEARVERALAERFDLVWPWAKEVKQIDLEVFSAEAKILMNPELLAQWILPKDLPGLYIERLSPNEAEGLFLDRYTELCS